MATAVSSASVCATAAATTIATLAVTSPHVRSSPGSMIPTLSQGVSAKPGPMAFVNGVSDDGRRHMASMMALKVALGRMAVSTSAGSGW